ncbi:hypothetical protein MNBD_IGNAVI01-1483 [hydrothermal vent metagenome]|uniref:DUF2231 domain-containing protein n=1 Tax=hydrothermal vent metagenome TaxID=652676 RepID=A0A3B1CBP5_9ZZZZ
MLKINIKLLFTILIMASVLYAHEGHKKKKAEVKPDTLTIVDGDTIAINGMATEKFMAARHAEAEEEELEAAEEGEVEEVTIGAVFEHIHNKVIHFPIALTIIGLLLMILGYKDNKYLGAIKIIIPFAALMTIVAVFAGLSQAEPFEGTAAYGLVETHELLGFGVLASLILWSIALYVKKLEKFIWALAILTFLLVSAAGLYGGVIAQIN